MTSHVYPDPQGDPLSLAPGTTSAPVPIVELFGSSAGDTKMFIRYVLIGSGCAPPVSPAPTVFLIADGIENEITSVDNVNVTPIAGGRAFATVIPPGTGGRAVFKLEVSKFTPDPIAWKIRFRNNGAVAHQLTWVVADVDAESRQPWMELPHRADWPAMISGIPAGQVVPLTVQVANKGTGNLAIGNIAGPLGATGFALSAPLAAIAPNACGNLTFGFTVPASPGVSTASFTAESNDPTVPAGPTTTSHNGQLVLAAEVGVPEPVFTSSPNQFDPQKGAPGTPVTLFGRNFTIGGSLSVKFGNVAALARDPTSTGVTAVVPEGLPLGPVRITVETGGGKKAVSDDDFTVEGLRPRIDRFTPTRGHAEDPDTSTPGMVVTITGDHFEGGTSVRFRDEPAVVDDVTVTRIRTSVPPVRSGNYFITVATRWGEAESTVPFVVVPKPAFTASPNQFSPPQGPPGITVTLRGRRFNVGVPRVMFGDVAAARVGDPTPAGVTAVVPVGLPLVPVPITVTTDEGTAVSDDFFTVEGLPPQLVGCTPAQGRSEDPKTSTSGTTVEITGNHFEVGTTTVKFGGVQAVVDDIDITGTRIRTKVPIVDSGNQVISVATQWGPAPSTVPFVVFPKPAFNSSPNQFSPQKGASGLSVTLFGRNFNVGTSRVMFGSVAAASVSIPTSTGVTAVVPGGLPLGGVPITVTTDGGTVVTDDLFTVQGLPPKIGRFTPPRGRPENPTTRARGTIVTITGSNFEAGAAVRFGGKEAVADNITNIRIRVKVPIIDGGKYVIAVSTQWGEALSAVPFDAVQGNPTYVVQRGDTLGGIAMKLGVRLQVLKALNPQIKDFDRIEIGQIINIPLTYVVERGDTMGDIAVTFRMSLQTLSAANPQIPDINRIVPGQVIIIP